MTIHQRRRTKVTRKIYGSKLKQMYQWQRFNKNQFEGKIDANYPIEAKSNSQMMIYISFQTLAPHWHLLIDIIITITSFIIKALSGWKAAPMINDDHKHHLFELRPTSPSNKCRIYSCNWPPKTYDDHHHHDHHIQLMMRMVRIPEVLK